MLEPLDNALNRSFTTVPRILVDRVRVRHLEDLLQLSLGPL